MNGIRSFCSLFAGKDKLNEDPHFFNRNLVRHYCKFLGSTNLIYTIQQGNLNLIFKADVMSKVSINCVALEYAINANYLQNVNIAS